MKVRVINNIVEFKKIKDDWELLYSLSKVSIFQSFVFNYLSWKNELSLLPNNSLAILLVVKNNQISSIFPFYVDVKKRLRFINDTHSDFCDFITQELVNFSELYSHLNNFIYFKSIHLINIKQDSNSYKSIYKLELPCKIIAGIGEHSFLKVNQGDFPYNVPHYRSHQKHRINKAFRKYLNQKHEVLSIEDSRFPRKEVELLKNKMTDLGIRKKDFITQARLKLIEELYNSGTIILNTMEYKGQLEVINIILKESSSRFLLWIDLFSDKQMINIASYSNFLKYMSLKDKVEISFGRGRYFYKESNFAPIFHQLYGLYIFSNQYQKVRFIIFKEVTKLIRLIYRKLRKLRK